MANLPIADKATLDAVKSLIGALADAANPAGNILARLADLEAKVGAINPSADGTDTLFKYIHQVMGKLGSGIPLIYSTYKGGASITADSFQTVLEVSGPGILLWCSCVSAANTVNGGVQVTLDSTICTGPALNGTNNYTLESLGGMTWTSATGTLPPIFFAFANTLKIECKSDGTRSVAGYWIYLK